MAWEPGAAGELDVACQWGPPSATGPSLLPLGFAYLESSRLRTAALNAAQVLADRSGQSVRVGTLHDTEVLVIHHVRGRNDPQPALDSGSLAPLHATALGKVLLTGVPELLADLALHDLRRFTPATITDPVALQREVDKARERGWAIAVGEILPGMPRSPPRSEWQVARCSGRSRSSSRLGSSATAIGRRSR